jgi:CRISPR/Cas system CSM-associated protein Csm5 (group 7 of RAMP superfamily)
VNKQYVKKHYKMRIRILTPTFIGGGQEYIIDKTKYIYEPGAGELIILDEAKWAEFLGKNNKFDSLIRFYSQSQNMGRPQKGAPASLPLLAWLKRENIQKSEYEKLAAYKAAVEARDKSTMNDVHLLRYISIIIAVINCFLSDSSRIHW